MAAEALNIAASYLDFVSKIPMTMATRTTVNLTSTLRYTSPTKPREPLACASQRPCALLWNFSQPGASHGNGSAKKAVSLSWRTNGFLAASCASVAAVATTGAPSSSSSSSEG